MSELALSAMVRIVTHPRVFEHPSAPVEALALAEALLGADAVTVVRPGPRHWEIFAAPSASTGCGATTSPTPTSRRSPRSTEPLSSPPTGGFARFGVRTLDPTAAD